jgi:glycosyltransferase involved in cell wall biosynthesis
MDGQKGAGAARNLGVWYATAPFLVFLDADDYLYPNALEVMVQGWKDHEAAIYGDYTAIATVEDVSKLTVKDQNNLLQYNEKTKEALINYRLSDYDVAKAMRQPENPPFIWCNVTTLIPKAWHTEIGGFDEEMPSWEDVDFWLRLAWIGKPFKRIEKPLLVYRFNTGGRRETGIKHWDSLIEYIRSKKDGM